MRKLIFILIFFFNFHCLLGGNTTLTLFGYPISSRIGIAACPLTATSKGTTWAANNSYDIITYKTIRTSYSPVKSTNIYRVDIEGQCTKQQIGSQFKITNSLTNSDNLAITNLFGISSSSPNDTIEDIKRARIALSEGQILIVSIYGSGKNDEEQIEDFVAAAQIAYSGGAHIIEANLSCPNLGQKEFIYKKPELVYAICKAISITLPNIPFTIKVGVFDNEEQMKSTILAAYNGGARGICGINTIPVQVIDANNKPVYGPENLTSGLSGTPIHNLALDFVKNARNIINEEKLDMVLFACGGVTQPQDFNNLLIAGADIALCATGALFHQELALKYHKLHNNVCYS